MTAAAFLLALVRVVAVLGPVAVTAWLAARRLGFDAGTVGVLGGVVLAVALLLVGTEALGLVKAISTGALCALFTVCAIAAWLLRGGPSGETTHRREFLRSGRRGSRAAGPRVGACAAAAVVLVATLWIVQVTNVLGGGMLSFDTLWYHMPFAAQFAQTGSVTAIQFTQADPFVAYYPANSELLHGVGIVLFHNDFLSPFVNVGWMAMALLAAWCMGRPWRAERGTLIAGCLVLALPVISITQPGDAFSDTPGLAMLMAAAALIVNAQGREPLLLAAALALGFAIGTKYTFIVPGIVLAVGAVVLAGRAGGPGEARGRGVARGAEQARAPSPARGWGGRAALMMLAGIVVTGGWWYLRALVADGNPLGLRLHFGPVTLPGPTSPVASSQQTAVISSIFHSSLWFSRFAPGLHYALGPIWPVVILIAIAAVIAGLYRMPDPRVRLIAIAAIGGGLTYLFVPAGAAILRRTTLDFQVNVRYATPALVFAFVLIPIRQAIRPGRLARYSEALLLVVIVATQFAAPLWPRQTGRHALVLLVIVALVGAGFLVQRRLTQPVPTVRLVAAIGVAALVAGVGAFALQRHYFHRRYLVGSTARPLSDLYRWAQGVSNARIAVYGSVEQYPLYGARDTNRVTYLGQHLGNGGFAPIRSCSLWRRTLAAGHYQYVVLSPGPTPPVPLEWTQGIRGATIVARPAYAYVALHLARPSERPSACS